MKQSRRTGALLFATLAAACSREGAERGIGGDPQPLVRDSADVRIVQNRDVLPSRWRVGPSPLFTLGWGADEPTFSWIQSGRILPDDGALVGDFRAGVMYRVGPDGSVVGAWGRKGEGPGEYQGFDAILVIGDSIFISDGRLRRITVLSSGGELLTTRSLAGALLHQVSTMWSDGRLLLVPGESYDMVSQPRPEWVFETQPILAVHLERGITDTLAELPHLRRWYGDRAGSPGPASVKGRAGGFADGFAWARADERQVRWYDGAGHLVQIARWDEEPVPLTSEWRNAMIREYEKVYRSRGAEEAFVAAQLAELEEGLDQREGPLPYWSSFHVDRQGNVWLSEYPLPMQSPRRWRVVAHDGTFVGWVDLPGVSSILDITDDRILAVRLNELDVPAVVMFELFKQ